MRRISFSLFAFHTIGGFIFFIWIASPNLSAQSNSSKLSPRQVLDRGVIAMGGKEKLKAVTSRQAFGSIKRLKDGAIGSYEVITQYPDSYFSRIAFGDEFEQTAMNRISAYEWSSGNGLKPLREGEFGHLRLHSEYQNGYWYHDELQRASGLGKFILRAAFGVGFVIPMDDAKRNKIASQFGKPMDSILFDHGQALQASLYFDSTSGRLAAEERKEVIQVGDHYTDRKELFLYDDFKTVDGIIEPHLILFTRDKEEYEIRLDKIVFNQAIDPVKFDVPIQAQSDVPVLTEVIAKATRNQESFLSIYDQFQYDDKYKYCGYESSSSDDISSSSCSDRTMVTEVSYYRGFPVYLTIRDSWGKTSIDKEYKRQQKAKNKLDKIISEKLKKGVMPAELKSGHII